MKTLTILGSTGSIGRNALRIVDQFPDRFRIKALTAKSNIQLLAEQTQRFHPDLVVVFDRDTADRLAQLLPSRTSVEIQYGHEGYIAAARSDETQMVLGAMVGAAGLLPTIAAIDAGKDIALANKETLVMAGELVMEKAKTRGVNIIPVDSEHSAIFQCLTGHRRADLERIVLTASGGPFRDRPAETFDRITRQEALNHPNWKMGEKITIDSATMMNKGLEVIEAKWLFGVPHQQIEVIVHPQSIVHSMVAYVDGAVIAQLGIPDMRGAIAYAFSHPERLSIGLPVPNFDEMGALTFRAPDLEKFPCLGLAFDACAVGGTMPAVLNAANETAVHAFLDGEIPFQMIDRVIRDTMAQHKTIAAPDLTQILDADVWARATAGEIIDKTPSEARKITAKI